MSYSYEVINTQRISMVSFRRATPVPPKLNRPEIDDRGYFRQAVASLNPELSDVNLGIDRGPVVGVTEDDTVFVELNRERIDKKAQLFVTSSDPATLKVATSWGGNVELPKEEYTELKITGVKGGGGVAPKAANVEIRYGSPTGVIIGELRVYVFTKMWVNIVPHFVAVSGADGPGLFHIFEHQEMFEMVNAIWQPCGIGFFIGAPVDHLIVSNVNQVGKWRFPEREKMFRNAKHSSDAINIYFVNEIVTERGGQTNAYTWNPRNAKEYGEKAGIISGTDTGLMSDLAHTIAHEIGHFLGLAHTDNRQIDKTKPHENLRQDIWTKDRMLMFPYEYLLNDGFLLTMKDLYDVNDPSVNHTTDPEWVKARKTVNSKAGPY